MLGGESIQTVLCAIDLSAFGAEVVEQGAAVADRLGARLILFHTVPVGDGPVPPRPPDLLTGRPDKVVRRPLEWMERLMAGRPGGWEPLIRVGDPIDELHRAVAEISVDLVVAASRGISLFRRILSGTVVERMARSLPVPLLVIPKGEAKQRGSAARPWPGKILVGCDPQGDPGGVERMIGYARRLAGRGPAEIRFLHAMEAPVSGDHPEADRREGHYQEAEQAAVRRLKGALKTRLAAAGIDPGDGIMVVPGVPGEALCSHGAAWGADLLVVGVRRHGTLHKLAVGSTTETVLRRAPMRVLVVPEIPGGTSR